MLCVVNDVVWCWLCLCAFVSEEGVCWLMQTDRAVSELLSDVENYLYSYCLTAPSLLFLHHVVPCGLCILSLVLFVSSIVSSRDACCACSMSKTWHDPHPLTPVTYPFLHIVLAAPPLIQHNHKHNRCPESGSGYTMGGPIWARPLHDQEWVKGLLQQMGAESQRYAQHARLKGILTAAAEELPDVPLYYK